MGKVCRGAARKEREAMRELARIPVRWRVWERRGNHHARLGRASVATAAAALLCCAAAVPGARPLRAQDLAPGGEAAVAPRAANPYVQRGVPAEATAADGVVARERALAAGRRAAWERLAAEIGAPRNLSDAQIEGLVDSIIIEEERTTPTRYSGRLTVNFNPGRVRAQTGAGPVTGNAVGGGFGGTAAADPGAMRRALGPAVATVDAVARFESLGEWLELRRRLMAAPEVARLDIVAISVDGARLRLGLRAAPVAAAEGLLHGAGVALAPGAGPTGAGWQVGLARGY
jgi:hypothetical protein